MYTFLYQQDLSVPPEQNWVEAHPEYLKDGVLCAKENGCSLLIRNWMALGFMIPQHMRGKIPPLSRDAVLNLADLLLYPELPGLSISIHLPASQIIGLDALYRLCNLKTLCLASERIPEFHLDVSQLGALENLSLCKYSPAIANIDKAGSLKNLIIYAYPRENLQEFANLAKLQDLRVYHSRLQSLDGIENLTALEYLDIAYAQHLHDISALDRLETKRPIAKVILPKKFKRK